MLAQFVATAAPLVNCIQQIPQLYKTYTTKRVEDLSFETLILMLLMNVLWFTHGYFIADPSLLASASFSMLVNTCLITLYVRYKT